MNRVGVGVVAVTSVICAKGSLCSVHAQPIEFRSVLDNAPLDLKPQAHEIETDAVRKFKATGRNPYVGDESALSAGKELYQTTCQVCHAPGGTGKIGPSLIGSEHTYPRVATDVGMFEVIHGGTSGEMPSWSKRGMTQDQMLQIIAYVRTLKKPIAHSGTDPESRGP